MNEARAVCRLGRFRARPGSFFDAAGHRGGSRAGVGLCRIARMDPRTRVAHLREEIERHNHLYYVEGKPQISDREFDRLMAELATEHPAYGWERNKGYGTAEHAAALERHGPTLHHRRSFAPVASACAKAGP